MNKTEIRQLHNNLDKLIADGALSNKYIILFGANKTSDLTCSYLGSKGLAVNAIIDNFPEKSGRTVGGVEVCSPSVLFADFEHKENAVILIASVYHKEMKRSVSQYGFDDSQFLQTLTFAEYSASREAFQKGVDNVMSGFEVYNRIKHEFGEDVFIIFNPCPSIGDAVLISSYLEEYIMQRNIGSYIYVVTGAASEKITRLYGNIKSMRISNDEALALVALCGFMGQEDISVLSFTVPFTGVYRRFYARGLINWGDIIRGAIMRLDPSAPKTPLPRREECVDGFFEENGLCKGKTAILATAAVQAESLPDEFWRALIERLAAMGYTVRFNVAPNESVNIEGALPLFMPLELVVDAAEAAGLFIGVRSGLCDLVGFASCKKLFIYPDKDFFDFYGIENIGLADEGSDNIELVYCGVNETVELIMKRI